MTDEKLNAALDLKGRIAQAEINIDTATKQLRHVQSKASPVRFSFHFTSNEVFAEPILNALIEANQNVIDRLSLQFENL